VGAYGLRHDRGQNKYPVDILERNMSFGCDLSASQPVRFWCKECQMGRYKASDRKPSSPDELLKRNTAVGTIREMSTEGLNVNNVTAGNDSGIELAAIEYVGIAGISQECQDAVLRLIHFGNRITHARILSCSTTHCLLLTVDVGDYVAVKSGFASGYRGEGPRRFSYVLQVLDSHRAEIEEYKVSEEFLDRLDNSALTKTDLEMLESLRPCRPSPWHDYVFEKHFEDARNGTLWQQEFPAVIPLALIDSRIIDLALSFWSSPDNNLLLGYRRLEDIVRRRTGIDQHGAKLFSQAFNPSGGALTWNDADDGERSGRMQLFTATYSAHRNPRAHRELSSREKELLSEFLLLNHLYRLEKESAEAKDG
jgi:hypothetical protein